MKYLKTYENKEPEKNIKYYDDGNIRYISYILDSQIHREDGPAFQEWHENGNVKLISYKQHNKYHRENGPALTGCYYNGKKMYMYYFINGDRHREDGPAFQEWHKNGQIKDEEYYLNNVEYYRKDWVEKLKEMDSPHYEEQKMLYNIDKYNL